MKIFSVIGVSQSGKTTTIEKIIGELKKRNYRVGSVKEIHCPDFTMETEGSNTHRHREAGSELVVARGLNETNILFQEHLPLEKIIRFYDCDYLVLEGVREDHIPKIITAHTLEEVEERMDDCVFLLSGRMGDVCREYKGLDSISPYDDIQRIVDIIEAKVEEYVYNEMPW